MKVDLEQLRELIRLLDEANLTEIEVEHDDDRIRVRRDPAAIMQVATQSVAGDSGAPSAEAAAADEPGVYVTSPFVGTFYRAPTPDGDPFVEVGDEIVLAGYARDKCGFFTHGLFNHGIHGIRGKRVFRVFRVFRGLK